MFKKLLILKECIDFLKIYLRFLGGGRLSSCLRSFPCFASAQLFCA